MPDSPLPQAHGLDTDLFVMRVLMESRGVDEVTLEYAEEMWLRHGCPQQQGYPCQGIGDFGAHDVMTHCPAACWVGVARGDGDGR